MSEIRNRIDNFLENRVRKLFDENTLLREEIEICRADQALLSELRAELKAAKHKILASV